MAAVFDEFARIGPWRDIYFLLGIPDFQSWKPV
jgi:hypothetical protein